MRIWGIIATALLVLLVLLGGVFGCDSQGPIHVLPPSESTPKLEAPSPATNLTAEPLSANAVKLQWTDSSANEDGFKIYRGTKLIGTVHSNLTTYQDTNLKPATTYEYMIRAYNAAGESAGCSCTVRTPNPPITIRLEKIGVYDNREVWARGRGEVYVGIAVSDGKTTIGRRFPLHEGQHFTLDKNETVNIGEIVFSVDEVGDYLTVFITGYESDGGPLEQVFYKALGAAAQGYVTGGSGTFLEAFEYSLGDLIGSIFGAEDDWLGQFEQTWGQYTNWGVGSYKDIGCRDERGVECLRVWFTIASP